MSDLDHKPDEPSPRPPLPKAFQRHLTRRDLPKPPPGLDKVERDIWRRIVAEFEFKDSASRDLLRVCLEAHERMRLARERIRIDGMTVTNKFGETVRHPLLTVEAAARTAYVSGMRVLRLDIGLASPK